jgi:hypothetical protein
MKGDVNLWSNLVIQSFSTGWGYDASYDASYDATMTALMTYFGGNPPDRGRDRDQNPGVEQCSMYVIMYVSRYLTSGKNKDYL